MATFLPIPDAYDRRARLLPAILFSVLPTLGVALFAGELGSRLGQTLLGTSGFFAMLTATAAVIRSRGRVAQVDLFKRWGGAPTLRFLRLQDPTIDQLTTRRYHTFLKERIDGFNPPASIEEEKRDPARADSQYISATKWLLEFTRDEKRFPLVAKENANYGLHRNLFGLRGPGSIVSLVCIAWSIIWAWVVSDGSLEQLPAEPMIFGFCSLIFLLAWRLWITEAFVREAADAYALALLASCEKAKSTNNNDKESAI